jgi:hypothetical protein
VACVLGGCSLDALELAGPTDQRVLIERAPTAPPRSDGRPRLLVLALDGVDRALLYDLLRAGALPELEALLGGRDGTAFPHAVLADGLLATLPASTVPAWVTAFTGLPPAVHGIPGNEFFIRERRELAVPVTGAVEDGTGTVRCYTDEYLAGYRSAASVYERMRLCDPHVLIWSAMQHFHPGADRLLLTDRSIVVEALRATVEDLVEKNLGDEDARAFFEAVDDEIVDQVIEALDEDGPPPDVLTVYLSGADMFAHVAKAGPDRARRAYLTEVLDPLFGDLHRALAAHGALADRWIVVTADHGHTEVLDDDAHSLATGDDDEPDAVLRAAGFRVRPFEIEVPAGADFQAVLGYQGAMAYVYVADRSTCPAPGTACDWTRPPRFVEDVLPVADAFFTSDRDGRPVPALAGTLDLVLTRRPVPVAEVDLPFEVYVGGGRLVPVEAWLRAHPHPAYVALPERLRDLAVGPVGERAGDVVLIARNADATDPAGRWYFSSPVRSHHGSPSRRDGEVPLVVAHPSYAAADVAALVDRVLGPSPTQQRVTDVLLALRYADSTGTACLARTPPPGTARVHTTPRPERPPAVRSRRRPD